VEVWTLAVAAPMLPVPLVTVVLVWLTSAIHSAHSPHSYQLAYEEQRRYVYVYVGSPPHAGLVRWRLHRMESGQQLVTVDDATQSNRASLHTLDQADETGEVDGQSRMSGVESVAQRRMRLHVAACIHSSSS